MRVVFAFVLALCVGVGACFGSAQAANSAKANGRIVKLKIGDLVVLGNAQCRVFTNSPRHPIEYAHVQCSNGPLSKATYSFVTNGFAATVGIDVFQKGVSGAIYSTNQPPGNHQVGNSAQPKGRIVRLSVGDVAVVLNGPGRDALVRVQCRAFSHSALRCAGGPLSKAPHYAAITNAGIKVYKKGSSAPIYTTPTSG
ncbi:MAG TPA: hypothetical protein VFU30_10120 [Gaiellaceae bacterium]|nr:hypothetical protein [Gaiellaceae bacterium]